MANPTGRATRASTRSKTTAHAPTAPTATKASRTKTAAKASGLPTALPTTTKRTATRKPLNSRDNSAILPGGPSNPKVKAALARTKSAAQSSDREPIMAYLRIRPHLGDEEPTLIPYLTPLSDATVQMTDPQENQGNRARFRSSAVPPSSLYTFSHVFPPETTQSDFFTKTTLPLVRDVLQGQNGLLFTYGVTNSGKTYTVQGGNKQGSAGILPRTLDVIFNSIEGLQGDGKYCPVRLYGIELSDANDSNLPQLSTEPALTEVLGQLDSNVESDLDADPTMVTVDRNYEYSVWISYVEVYNEKVYDLLDSIKDNSSYKQPQKTAADRSLLLTRKALPLRPSPASDSGEAEISGKYIAGLRQFRVNSAAQAKTIVKLGQLHRRVFGTLANRESSRSHGMVIIKIVRGHRGEKDDPTSLQVSRLTLVDLAGSERTKHTHTTGQRLKEAGNINKSLMVLGQCMEIMRSNQRKLAASLSQEYSKDGRMDTRDVKKTLAVIPFRHSKLTEVLMDYFIGEGRAVMIVNVNPYDTGYDENSHVMKFAALAREVYITNAPAPVHKASLIGPGKLQGQKFKDLNPLTMNDPEVNPNPFRRKVTIPIGAGKKKSEAILEVVEEDEPTDEADDNDDEPLDPLIDALFDEVENLRMQLFEAEIRCAIIEAETREEVIRETEERMRMMEEKYSRRLMSELEQNELKTDAKIDMLHKAGLFGNPVKNTQSSMQILDEEDEDVADVEMSLMAPGEESEDDISQFLEEDMSMSSPLANKPPIKGIRTLGQTNPPLNSASRKRVTGSELSPDLDDNMTDDSTDDNVEATRNDLLDLEAEEMDEGDGDEDEDEYVNDESEGEDEDEDEDWNPSNNIPSRSTKTSAFEKKWSAPVKQLKQPRVSKLEREMKILSIEEGTIEDPDESAVILPVKSKRVKKIVLDSDSETELKGTEIAAGEYETESAPVVKKKRQLGKKPVMTVDSIERVTWEVEKKVTKAQGDRTIRRLTGN